MIPNGTAGSGGLRASINLFTGGVATIAPSSTLPAVTAPLVLDAQTQPGWTSSPIVELNGTNAGTGARGLSVAAAATTIRGFVINRFDDAGIRTSAAGTTIQGNHLGTNPAGTVASPNRHGIHLVSAASATIGGTTTAARNVVAGNRSDGIRIEGAVAGTTVRGNSIWGNAGLGIDLGGDGATANDGALSTVQPNAGMDTPVITRATVGNGALRIVGHVGSAPNQTAFAGAQVEVFVSDASSPIGQGRTFLGTLTATSSGNLDGSITPPAGVTVTEDTTRITATATSSTAGTSEFSPSFLVTSKLMIRGTVFEDHRYGGGAGRSFGTAGGTGVAGARVEAYDATTGAFVAAAATDSIGGYALGPVAAGSYTVRVVDSTVPSSRPGWSTSLVPVLTFRSEAPRGVAEGVTGEVGGANPTASDAPAGAPGTSLGWTYCSAEYETCTFTGQRLVRYGLNGRFTYRVLTDGTPCSNSVFTDPLYGIVKACWTSSVLAQSLGSVTVSSTDVTGIDFGYSFDVVVNTNDSGQGSLRQAITNANALGGDASSRRADAPPASST